MPLSVGQQRQLHRLQGTGDIYEDFPLKTSLPQGATAASSPALRKRLEAPIANVE